MKLSNLPKVIQLMSDSLTFKPRLQILNGANCLLVHISSGSDSEMKR